MLNRLKINSTGQLTHMIAKDMFAATKKQVFSAKSGTIDTAGELNFEPENEPQENQEPEIINPSQLQLF